MDDIRLVQETFEDYLLVLDAERWMFNMPMDVLYKFDFSDLLHSKEKVTIFNSERKVCHS